MATTPYQPTKQQSRRLDEAYLQLSKCVGLAGQRLLEIMQRRDLTNLDVAELCEEYFGSGGGVSDNVVQALVRGESNTYSGVELLTLLKLELALSETLVEIYFPYPLPEPEPASSEPANSESASNEPPLGQPEGWLLDEEGKRVRYVKATTAAHAADPSVSGMFHSVRAEFKSI